MTAGLGEAVGMAGGDLDEVLYAAMVEVGDSGEPGSPRFFGAVGSGTFFADGDPGHTRFYEGTPPAEALCELAVEFGGDFTEGLDPFGASDFREDAPCW